MLHLLPLFSMKVWLWHTASVDRLVLNENTCSQWSIAALSPGRRQSDKDTQRWQLRCGWMADGPWELKPFFVWHMFLSYWQEGMELVVQNETQYKKLKRDLKSLSQYKTCREKLLCPSTQSSSHCMPGLRPLRQFEILGRHSSFYRVPPAFNLFLRFLQPRDVSFDFIHPSLSHFIIIIHRISFGSGVGDRGWGGRELLPHSTRVQRKTFFWK